MNTNGLFSLFSAALGWITTWEGQFFLAILFLLLCALATQVRKLGWKNLIPPKPPRATQRQEEKNKDEKDIIILVSMGDHD